MFFEQFHQPLGTIPSELVEPLRVKVLELTLSEPEVKKRSDPVLVEGVFITTFYQGKGLGEWHDLMKPIIEYMEGLKAPCMRDRVPYKTELSIIPPGGSLHWHHDIYLKDKLTERIHVPVITSDDVVFYHKWHTDPAVYAYKMQHDKIYRFNNRALHTVKNAAKTTRCHILFNYIRKDILDYMIAHPEELATFEDKVRSITAADESYHYINHKPAHCVKLQTEHPAEWDLTDHMINRLLNNTNTWVPGD